MEEENLEEKVEEKTEEKSKKKKVKIQAKKDKWWVWPIKIFFLAVALSLSFSILSELVMSSTGIVLAIICIIFFISISVLTDMIGIAVTACDEEPFKAMAARKVKGAKEALTIIKNADKVASLCADVMGDVCGILSGAAGASILVHLIREGSSQAYEIIIASLVSALIAGLTIFGKAIFKRYAMDNSVKIVLRLGKICSVFSRKNK